MHYTVWKPTTVINHWRDSGVALLPGLEHMARSSKDNCRIMTWVGLWFGFMSDSLSPDLLQTLVCPVWLQQGCVLSEVFSYSSPHFSCMTCLWARLCASWKGNWIRLLVICSRMQCHVCCWLLINLGVLMFIVSVYMCVLMGYLLKMKRCLCTFLGSNLNMWPVVLITCHSQNIRFF